MTGKHYNEYLKKYGPHFNKKLCEFAVSMMETDEGKISPLSKTAIDEMLVRNDIQLQYNSLRDYVYVANMCKADFLGDSVPDEKHMCRYIKNVVDDPDGYDGQVFNRWISDMDGMRIPINWSEFI